ncbi:MAG: response regulator transcription factor [Hyphomicrobiales bacterium]
MSTRILVVDDDAQLATFLQRYLRKQEFDVATVGSAAAMMAMLARRDFDLCVLDIGLPDRDGFELTQELRRTSKLPIILLTARDEVYDRIIGLEVGADDYVTKPFEPRELVARIKSVLRRYHAGGNGDDPAAAGAIRFGRWLMNLPARTLVDVAGNDARLTSTEFDLLRALAERPNIVLSRDQLLDRLKGNAQAVTDRTIDAHVARLRRKIEDDPSDPSLIKTVHGAGYVFTGA